MDDIRRLKIIVMGHEKRIAILEGQQKGGSSPTADGKDETEILV